VIPGLLAALLLAFLIKWLWEKAPEIDRIANQIALYGLMGGLSAITAALLLAVISAFIFGGNNCRTGFTCLTQGQAYVVFLLGGIMFFTAPGVLLGIAYGKNRARKEEIKFTGQKFIVSEDKGEKHHEN